MRQTIAGNIGALLLIMGSPKPYRQQCSLFLEKIIKSLCSFRRAQLSFMVNTGTMTVVHIQDKLVELQTLVTNWHNLRKNFTMQQITNLVGILQHAGKNFPWIKYLLSIMYNSVCISLHKNKKSFPNPPEYMKCNPLLESTTGTTVPDKHKSFALSYVIHGVWYTSHKILY